MNTQHDITVSGKPLNPPKPPAKPHMLLWIDTETTGISRTNAKLLEIGMIVTSMDGIEEHDRFICPVRPDHVSLYDLDPKVLRMHLDNGLLDTVMETEPNEFNYANVARNLGEFIRDEASQYELHPAGTNVDYDIDVLTNQLGPHLHPDWLRQLTNHRKLDLSTYRISDLALDHNPYKGHAGTHRVEDCIRRHHLLPRQRHQIPLALPQQRPTRRRPRKSPMVPMPRHRLRRKDRMDATPDLHPHPATRPSRSQRPRTRIPHMARPRTRRHRHRPRQPRHPPRPRKEPTMSTRIYCDQCGTETSKRKALRFSLSGYSANRTSMGQLNDIEIDICPDCAQRFNDQTIGTIHIRRDHRDKLSPYLLEYQSTDLKEDQA